MNYANIKYNDIANGPGTRVSLFVSGCTHHCRNCFNQEAWDFNAGKPFDEAAAQAIIDASRPDYIHGLSILGGEPFELENQQAVMQFIWQYKQKLPEKTVWMWSGYSWEHLTGMHKVSTLCTDAILSLIDVLVDGEYIEALRDVSLRFRGSANQRIIDVKQSFDAGQLVLWQDERLFSSHQW